jgi:hypothetical protein
MNKFESIKELLDLTAVVPLLAGVLQRFGGDQPMLTGAEQKALEYALEKIEARREALERAAGLADEDGETGAAGIPDGEEAGDLFS